MQKVIDFFKYCLGSLLDIIFPGPSSCTACGRLLKEYSGVLLCSSCLKELEGLQGYYVEARQFFSEGKSDICPEGGFDFIGAPFRYEGAARAMVKGLKYKGRISAAHSMAIFMSKELGKRNLIFDLIVPVPAHIEREKQRGYNQAELIAREVSRIIGVPMSKALIKTQNTPSQVTLDEGRRWSNIKDAFCLVEAVQGLRILLIDDVATTGATMFFSSCQLKKGGASHVVSLAFAVAMQGN